MKPIARIEGIPRRKKYDLRSCRDLETEIKTIVHFSRMYAPVGVIGFPNSGRKTLSYRFGRMEEGTFDQEVPVMIPYVATIEGVIYPLELNRRFVLLLKFYVINPERFPPHHCFLESRDWNEFCCMIFVFDVTDIKTFRAVPVYLNHMMTHSFNIQRNFLIVGNKSDLRRAPVTRSRPEVNAESAEKMAIELEGTYFECSAKKPENIKPILEAIKNFGAKKRYQKH